MSFDLYAPAAAPAAPPSIPGFKWNAESDGTWTCWPSWIPSRMLEVDRERLKAIGIDLARFNEGRTDYYHKLRFTPGIVGARRLKEGTEELIEKHAAYIADRARIDAGHAARAERAATAMARAQACLDKYPAGFSRNPAIRELITGYPGNTILLRLDVLANATEAQAKKKGIAL